MTCLFCPPEPMPCAVCGGREFQVARPEPDAPLKGRDVKDFATAKHPLRCSGLGQLVQCPWRTVMKFLFELEDGSGEAADTGSATHAAVAAWHLMGQDAAAAVQEMVRRNGEFPRANLDEAAALFLRYTQDRRNKEAVFPDGGIECQVEFLLPPCEEDPTGEAIHVIGTLDQVRRDFNNRLKVWDLKTSRLPGRDLLNDHMHQLAGYSLGAAVKFGEPVDPGGIIRARSYPDDAYFPCVWDHSRAKFVLWGIRRIVASIRSGEVWHMGGQHCRWCPAGSTDVCVPRLASVVDATTMKIDLQRCLPRPDALWPDQVRLDAEAAIDAWAPPEAIGGDAW